MQIVSAHLPAQSRFIKSKCIDWINTHTYSLSTSTADTGFADLIAVGEAIGESQIVGAGESTHGTKEFYTQKLRLFKYLVLHKGFTTLLIEDGYAAVEAVNRYIHHEGITTNDSILFPLYGFLRTSEIAELFDWMKAFNHQHDQILNCVGIDAQNFEPAVSNVIAFGRQFDTSFFLSFNKVQAGISKVKALQYDDTLLRNTIITELNYCIQLLHKKEAATLRTSHLDTITFLYQNCRSLLQCLVEDEYRWNNRSVRDYFMNINVLEYLEKNPAAKVFLWAHNGHIAEYEGTEDGFQVGGTLGHYLKRHFGSSYFSIGMLTASGKYSASIRQNSMDFKIYKLPRAKDGSIEKLFSEARVKNIFLDLRHNSIPAFFKCDLNYRAAAFFWHKKQFIQHMQPFLLYDSIMYFDRTQNTEVIYK